jgi:hypothetical protein
MKEGLQCITHHSASWSVISLIKQYLGSQKAKLHRLFAERKHGGTKSVVWTAK